jgi:DNA-binding transcriptional regulator YiaG
MAAFLDKMQALPWNKKIMALRIYKDISQEIIADELGVHVDTYRAWENGRHYPGRLARRTLARYHGVTEIELFGGTNPGSI